MTTKGRGKTEEERKREFLKEHEIKMERLRQEGEKLEAAIKDKTNDELVASFANMLTNGAGSGFRDLVWTKQEILKRLAGNVKTVKFSEDFCNQSLVTLKLNWAEVQFFNVYINDSLKRLRELKASVTGTDAEIHVNVKIAYKEALYKAVNDFEAKFSFNQVNELREIDFSHGGSLQLPLKFKLMAVYETMLAVYGLATGTSDVPRTEKKR